MFILKNLKIHKFSFSNTSVFFLFVVGLLLFLFLTLGPCWLSIFKYSSVCVLFLKRLVTPSLGEEHSYFAGGNVK